MTVIHNIAQSLNPNIEAIYGDYFLSPFDLEASPRLILVARKMNSWVEVDLPARQVLRMRLTVSCVIPRYDASID